MVEPVPDRPHNLAEALDVLGHVGDTRGPAQRRLLSFDELLDAFVQYSLLQQLQLPQLTCVHTNAAF